MPEDGPSLTLVLPHVDMASNVQTAVACIHVTLGSPTKAEIALSDYREGSHGGSGQKSSETCP